MTWTAGAASRAVAAPVDDGAWHHLAIVSTSTGSTLYVDGRQADTAGPRAGSGAQLTLGEGFTGQVDEVRAWGTARTAAELAADAMRPVAADTAALARLLAARRGRPASTSTTPRRAPTTAPRRSGRRRHGDAAFTASQAWRLRPSARSATWSPAAAAGYDVDGDALALTSSPGAAPRRRLDRRARPAGALPGRRRLAGHRPLIFKLDDGEASSTYQLELEVERILTCQVTADCGGGDQCMQGVCVAPVRARRPPRAARLLERRRRRHRPLVAPGPAGPAPPPTPPACRPGRTP